MADPLAYRVRTQAVYLTSTRTEPDMTYTGQLDAFARTVLLGAYRAHGNKTRAAVALGLTYRQFRYHWDRLRASDASCQDV